MCTGTELLQLVCIMSERTALRVHVWAERGVADCGEAGEKLDMGLMCVRPEASPRLLHTWTHVAWIDSLYCWNSQAMGCEVTENDNSVSTLARQ